MNALGYRIIACTILVAGIFTAGYFFGWRSNHDDIVILTASLSQAAKDQKAAVKVEREKNDAITTDVANSYSAELDRLQHASSNNKPSPVPTTTNNTSKFTISNGQRGGTCKGSQFYDNALKCEEQLKWIREWVTAQRIPIK